MRYFNTIRAALLRRFQSYFRKLWVRVVIVGVLSFVALGMAQLLDLLLPQETTSRVHGEAADRLLQIIANAMLAVTTFSLTVMVTVYRNSSAEFTPRIHTLIMQDPVTQNTLATFIGTYVYALVAIVLREMGVYEDKSALVLFWMTVLVLCLVVWSLIRWVLHLQTFGSLLETTRQVERIARKRFEERFELPCLGAKPLVGDLPEDAQPIAARESGFVRHIHPERLEELAASHGITLYLTARLGTFVYEGRPLAWISGAPKPPKNTDKAFSKDRFFDKICAAISLGDVRSYDQDPRFGLMVMSEIGCKALSPGINDPGTAVDVITRVGRILASYCDETQHDKDAQFSHLRVPPLDAGDLLRQGFAAMARDGAKLVEVQSALQSVLAGLIHHTDAELRAAAKEDARCYLKRALAELPYEEDKAQVREVAAAQVLKTLDELAR